jgi:Fe-S-cluster-containing hydrogenase component 2
MANSHIIQHPETYSLCIGCQTCDIVCSLVHEGVTGPTHGRIKLDEPDYKHLKFRILVCEQCEDHPCYSACPKKGKAMCIDEQGTVYINEDECIGCGRCLKACKLSPPRIVMDKPGPGRKARKCDMCRTRKEGPACVEYCPVKCLGISPKTE